jgi:hypothetical protein
MEKGNEFAALDGYQTALSEVEAEVTSMASKGIEGALESLSTFEKAKLQTVLAYALTTLQICYARVRGERIADHPCMRQLDRIRLLFEKLDNDTGESSD